jgi:hypothetical protein
MCLYVYPSTIARQRVSKIVTAETNTHTTIEELLGVSFSMRSMSHEWKVGDYFFPEFIILDFPP